MLLSRLGNESGETTTTKTSPSGRVFECKTCKKQFHSFQALGGHRASHKKQLKLEMADLLLAAQQPNRKKPKKHECPICGLEFQMGQALGGHMRRHRSAIDKTAENHKIMVPAVVLKRSNSSNKRVFGLDLNLTPYENDLHLREIAPVVDCFL
ncbi:hypothetical protein ACH5RR_010025 [Cinchona calisaya]|uniref:C2H2-type domain-containing protein n=1 Tax=Cinchona calisaya TaxID=153742 RepID=A0ABD3AIJ5_9GENT